MDHSERETFNSNAGKRHIRRNFSVVLKLDKKASAGEWKKYSATFTVPHDMKLFSTYKGFANIYFANKTSGADVFFDNVRLIPFNESSVK